MSDPKSAPAVSEATWQRRLLAAVAGVGVCLTAGGLAATAATAADPLPEFGTPPSSVGRLLIDWGGETPSICTATVVDTADRNVVITAAHCVYKPWQAKSRPDSIRFQPQYDRGETPFGTWTAERSVPDERFGAVGSPQAETDPTYDAALVQFAPDARGRELADVVGASALPDTAPPTDAADPRATELYADVAHWGYPDTGNYEYGGERPVLCRDAAELGSGQLPADLALPCEMHSGSSGGPWFDVTADDAYGTVIAVESRGNRGVDIVTGEPAPTISYSHPLTQGFLDMVRSHRG